MDKPVQGEQPSIVGQLGSLDVDGFGALLVGRDETWTTVYEQEPIDAMGRMFEWSRLEAFVLLVQDFVDALACGRAQPVPSWDRIGNGDAGQVELSLQ